MSPAIAASGCRHCGLSLPVEAADDFCCDGCRMVHGLLRDGGLLRYYALRGERGVPVATTGDADHKWLEVLERSMGSGAQGTRQARLAIQGLHCAACVWLIESLFRRQPGALRIEINPARGTAAIAIGGGFPLPSFVADVEQFGYVLGPIGEREAAAGSSGLLLRMGVCIALALNAMSFAVAIYAGLDGGTFYEVARAAGWVLAAASVLVGGSVFIRSAWHALRRGILHLDLPIALGIVLAFAGSTWAFFTRAGAEYFDTVAIFIALMLVGRFLQERVLERNRRQVLASDGVDGLLTRRLGGARGQAELVKCTEIVAGDRLLIAPGDVVPVAAELLDAGATISLDWIEGESTPREVAQGTRLPAGAFNVGHEAVIARADADFAASDLVELLRTPRERDPEGARSTAPWRRFTALYVTGVLAAAAGGLVVWLLRTGDTVRALEVATAVLVVTCPCALGIATPLAYELVQSGLRRAGLFVRSAGFLDRAMEVRRIVFDKTGTLTTGRLRLADVAPLAALAPSDRAVLAAMAARSTHPKSAAVSRALEAMGPASTAASLSVREVPGEGMEAVGDGRVYRFGAPRFVVPGTTEPERGDLAFGRDGRVLALLRTVETLRPDAHAEIAALRRQGFRIGILSGDRPAQVAAMAAALGIPGSDALGGCSPPAKAGWLAAHDARDTLFVGDGLNDSLAVERAWCSGTPAVDRPFMPARSDFYFVTPGLGPIGLALRAARALGRVHRRNLAFALSYNAAVVSVAWAGWMSPLLAAVLMPLGSIAVLLATAASLNRRSPLWKS